jgi:hypothetical protein
VFDSLRVILIWTVEAALYHTSLRSYGEALEWCVLAVLSAQ